MSIQVTAAAAKHIVSQLQKRGHGVGLRVRIKISGCSGYAYETDYADEVADDDAVFSAHGSQVVIDQKSLALMKGTTIDYQAKGLNWLLVFNNPRAKALCGCGESFSIAPEDTD